MAVITYSSPIITTIGKDAVTLVEDGTPSNYRLKRTIHGEIVLQGCFKWTRGSEGGFTWKDIPTVAE